MLVCALRKDYAWKKISKLINGLKLIRIAIGNHGARILINVRLNKNDLFFFVIRFLFKIINI